MNASRLSRSLYGAILVLALAGAGVSAYLTSTHLSGVPLACSAQGACETVQSSEYAEVLGMPVAVLGLGLYVAVGTGATVSLLNGGWPGDVARFAVFGLALAGALYSGYLTWVELYRLEAICQWCVMSALLLGATLVCSASEIALSGRWRAPEGT